MTMLASTEFEKYVARQVARKALVTFDQMIFCNIPGLSENNLSEHLTMPSESQIVHRTDINRAGYIDENKVVYSVMLGTNIGDFEFNYIALINKAENILAVACFTDTIKKRKNKGRTYGNSLSRNMILQFSGAKELTGINVSAESWQVDFTSEFLEIHAKINRLSDPDGFKHIGQVESIAQLRTIEPTEDQQRILVKSYYAGKNLGGGVFYADFADATSEDNGGTVIVTSGGKRWKRINTQTLTLWDFGIKQDTPQSDEINNAIQVIEAGATLVIPEGVWVVSDEIKLKSNMTLCGENHNSIIKTADGVSPLQNTITTENNTRAEHENYVENIVLRDLTVDGNYHNRSSTISAENQGSCVHLVTTKNFTIKNVIAKDAVLHCFDISASIYFDNGNINNTPLGPSLYGHVINCQAYNARRDDGFTTHNSGYITFSSCYSYRDREMLPPANNNHGFEADEGSFNINFENCLSVGHCCGYQAKGHNTTMPAHDINFENCKAEDCTIGFQASHIGESQVESGQTHLAHNIKFTNVRVKNPLWMTNDDTEPRLIRIYGYKQVVLNGLVSEQINDAFISVSTEADEIVLNNIHFRDASKRKDGDALIEVLTSSSGVVKVSNVSSAVAQPVTVVKKNSGNNTVQINGINVRGQKNGQPLIRLALNHGDSALNLDSSSNWTAKIFVTNDNVGLGNDDVSVEMYNRRVFNLYGGVDVSHKSLTGLSGCTYFNKSGHVYVWDVGLSKYVKLQKQVDNQMQIIKKGDKPAVIMSGFNNSDGHIAVDKGKYLRLGWWNEQDSSFTGVAGFTTNGYFVPLTNDQYKLGQSNLKWAELNLVTPPQDSNGDIGATTKWVRDLFTQSLTDNGWQRLPSGLIIQWGTYNANTESTFRFPIAFTRGCFAVLPVDYNSSGGNIVDITGTNKSAESFQILTQGGDVGLFSVIAIGV